jgi:hypothetical protein
MSLNVLLDHSSTSDVQAWKKLSVESLKLTNPSNQLIIQPNGQGNNSFTITAANPAANRVLTIPDVGGNAQFVLSGGSSPNYGSFTYNPTVSVGGVGTPSWLTYRSVWSQEGGIYTVGIGGTISVGTNASGPALVSLSFPLASLPGGAGIVAGSNLACGGSASFKLLPDGASPAATFTNAGILFNSPNVVISCRFPEAGGTNASSILVNATLIYTGTA